MNSSKLIALATVSWCVKVVIGTLALRYLIQELSPEVAWVLRFLQN